MNGKGKMDDIEEGKRMHKIVMGFVQKCIDQILEEDLNPTGLASMFLDQSMRLLDHNIKYCLKIDDPKGALSYLNIFMMDWDQKGSEIRANMKRIQDSLDGTERDGAKVHAMKISVGENETSAE